MLIKGQVLSLQYDLPEEGLTITADVSGGANMYISRTIRNPTFLTANITTGGSGILSVYVPPRDGSVNLKADTLSNFIIFVSIISNGSMKRQADTVGSSSTIFVSIIANRDNTTVRASTAVGNAVIRSRKSKNSFLCNNNNVLQITMATIWCMHSEAPL